MADHAARLFFSFTSDYSSDQNVHSGEAGDLATGSTRREVAGSGDFGKCDLGPLGVRELVLGRRAMMSTAL